MGKRILFINRCNEECLIEENYFCEAKTIRKFILNEKEYIYPF